eukprot:CAMPEP_0113304188 /NCGR_PEP_ID=MMETSP0010_2-20120614/4306_1 /TAXON_ID=216773 ORGANISM="Corethron hystrix, Strain 308" /NCGR_SAMPLE_ID=MMETSP0010_2 /ASSEMBLY_ACC=CAM_ASM_000155 /LENGTH=275 /DNA_ID=CAMNT_0000158339 /DNA_START=34 /DNA_END=861 /DNA_ORIENTATION=- /assembly_acc=CAM_ASM_000155
MTCSRELIDAEPNQLLQYRRSKNAQVLEWYYNHLNIPDEMRPARLRSSQCPINTKDFLTDKKKIPEKGALPSNGNEYDQSQSNSIKDIHTDKLETKDLHCEQRDEEGKDSIEDIHTDKLETKDLHCEKRDEEGKDSIKDIHTDKVETKDLHCEQRDEEGKDHVDQSEISRDENNVLITDKDLSAETETTKVICEEENGRKKTPTLKEEQNGKSYEDLLEFFQKELNDELLDTDIKISRELEEAIESIRYDIDNSSEMLTLSQEIENLFPSDSDSE